MSARPDLIDAVRDLVAKKFSIDVISEETDLLAEGVLDSVGLVHLILSLEQNFGIQIELNELEIDDVRSIHSIANVVSKLQPASSEACPKPARAVTAAGQALRVIGTALPQ